MATSCRRWHTEWHKHLLSVQHRMSCVGEDGSTPRRPSSKSPSDVTHLSVSLDVTPTTLRHVSLLWFSPLATRYSHSSCHRPHWFLSLSVLRAPTAAVPHPTHAWLPRVGWRGLEDDHVTRGGAAGPHDADTWRGGKCRQRVASRGSPAGRSFVKTKPASHVAASHSRF